IKPKSVRIGVRVGLSVGMVRVGRRQCRPRQKMGLEWWPAVYEPAGCFIRVVWKESGFAFRGDFGGRNWFGKVVLVRFLSTGNFTVAGFFLRVPVYR